jgi:hypothetical protein
MLQTRISVRIDVNLDLTIVLRKEWDDLAAKNPGRLSVKYVLDKEPKGWKGGSEDSCLFELT